MIGAHVQYTIKPGLEDRFLEWKRLQWEIQKISPGFIKRSMTRGIENPNVFYYVTLWETQEQINDFARRPDFLATKEQTQVDDTFADYEHDRIEGVFDDVVHPTPEGMIGTHVVYRMKPDGVDTFLTWKVHELEPQRDAPGFVKRWMARSLSKPTHFYYLTFWESKAHIDTFIETREFLETKEITKVDDAFESYTPIRVTEVFDDRVR
jgi:heme-degrading monooxygenase HmoA